MDVCVKRLAASGMSAEMVAESPTKPLEIVKKKLEKMNFVRFEKRITLFTIFFRM